MAVVSMKTLLESGVHFGHRTHKWNPNMKPYIFTERNGIHILNLQQTVKAIEEAHALIRDTVADGGMVLFVGTKRQAQETIQNEAERCGMPYVTARWLGGMLTNWRTIRERINELERIERLKERGDFDKLKKKERLTLQRQVDKLEMRLGGIRRMVRLPDLLFVVDVRREETAIHEANLLNIPVVAMVDTNCDPRQVDYVIPSNDDAIRAIKLMVGTIADAVVEGKALRKDDDSMEMASRAAEEPGPRSSEGMRTIIDEEGDDELTDELLLGAATLAKIQTDEEAVVEAEVVVEDAEAAEEEEAGADVEADEEEAGDEAEAEEPDDDDGDDEDEPEEDDDDGDDEDEPEEIDDDGDDEEEPEEDDDDGDDEDEPEESDTDGGDESEDNDADDGDDDDEDDDEKDEE